MLLNPRYGAAAVMSIDGDQDDQRVPTLRQRRRLQASLAQLSARDWDAPSRCVGWSIADVIAHLTGVNDFWVASIESGLRGEPTKWLVGFDPAVTPDEMVKSLRQRPTEEVRARFESSNEKLCSLLESLTTSEWSLFAEAPPGHLPIRLVASHAMWDAWIHERDVWLPLGVVPDEQDDEIASSLRYVAALSASFDVLLGVDVAGLFAITTSQPDLSFMIEVGTDVRVTNGVVRSGTPILEGRAASLLESLSFRESMPSDADPRWRDLMRGLAVAFNAPN